MLPLALTASFLTLTTAHGIVTGIVANGTYYPGYNPLSPLPNLASWSDPLNTDYGFIASSNFTSPDIICHISATPAVSSIPVNAGSSLQLQWTAPWTSGHHGPVLTYLAPCNGSCSNVSKPSLKFFKLGAQGLLAPTPFPGYYAADLLRDNNSTWTVTIPSTLKSGFYILRNEIIALHVAETLGGAQSYPQCVTLEVRGGGSEVPVGEGAMSFYGERDPGIFVDIWTDGLNGSRYVIPGPAVWKGAGNQTQPTPGGMVGLLTEEVE